MDIQGEQDAAGHAGAKHGDPPDIGLSTALTDPAVSFSLARACRMLS
jgi:hypothetical protein